MIRVARTMAPFGTPVGELVDLVNTDIDWKNDEEEMTLYTVQLQEVFITKRDSGRREGEGGKYTQTKTVRRISTKQSFEWTQEREGKKRVRPFLISIHPIVNLRDKRE